MTVKKRVTAALTAFVTVSVSVAAYAAYAASNPAQNLQEQGIIEGYEDGELHLERTLTRAEFTKIFCDAFLKDKDAKTKNNTKFPDVPSDFWGKDYIYKAVEHGVINGFDDGTFRPQETVTYEQAVKMIISYIDRDDSAAYPEGYILSALDKGIADGVPAVIGDTLTRKDAVYLIDNTLTYQEDNKTDYEEDDDGSFVSGMLRSFSYGSSMQAAAPASYDSVAASAGGAAAPGNGMPVLMEDSEAEILDGGVYETNAFYDDIYSYDPFNMEEYTANDENIFKNALTSPLSTFSIDTDTASYSNMRRFVLGYGRIPPNGSVRTEELINYFDYDNPLPSDGKPFEVSAEVAVCPWNNDNMLAGIAVQGDELNEAQPSNLVFLLDVSGSMYTVDKLPLVKKSLKMLLEELSDDDTISMVTYASGTSVVLESTPVSEKEKIIAALDEIRAGGATYGSAGINLAYEQAEKNLIRGGNNRIILCTDGDFNIGDSSTGDLEKLITAKRNKGIFLTVLGFGMGNYKDNRMEILADKGNGTYAYIDSEREAKKVFVDEMPKTLYTIAKDVKIQVVFNPAAVKEYRLIGYENRVMNNEDFDNDAKDAGELGCGAAVTALYEIVPADGTETADLKYQTIEITGDPDELMTVKVRYKEPDGDESMLIEMPVENDITPEPSDNFKFAASVAELGMLLNESEYKGTADYDSVVNLAKEGLGDDEFGFRTEFLHIADVLRYIDLYRDEDDYDYPIWYNWN